MTWNAKTKLLHSVHIRTWLKDVFSATQPTWTIIMTLITLSVLGFQVAAKSMKMDWAIKKFSYHQLSKKKRMSCLKPGWHLSHVAKFNSVEDAGCLMYKKQYPTWISLLFFSFPLLFLVQKSCWLKSISTDFFCFCYYLFYHQCRRSRSHKTTKMAKYFHRFHSEYWVKHSPHGKC